MNYFGFVYLWLDKKTKKYYIGSHLGSIDDGYPGGGTLFRRAFKKRPNDFKRRIIYYHTNTNRQELYDIEEEILVKYVKFEELGKRYYNLKRKGLGQDPEVARQIALEKSKNGNHPASNPKVKEKLRQATLKQIEEGRNAFVGPTMNAQLLSEGRHTSQRPESCKKISEARQRELANGTSPSKGKVAVKDKDGNVFMLAVEEYYIRRNVDVWHTSKYRVKGKKWYNDGIKNYYEYESEANASWERGVLRTYNDGEKEYLASKNTKKAHWKSGKLKK